MKTSLVSIIVPVYNVSKYLKQNFDSLINQTYKNIEIIFIDDGSTDDSGTICDSFQKQDSRIRVIHKQNEGLGLTRNVGISSAKGEYIMFLDADDFIDTKMVEILLNKIQETNSDVVYCGFNEYYNESNIVKRSSCFSGRSFTDDIFDNVILEMIGSPFDSKTDTRISMSSCMAIYSLDVIKKNNISFYSEREYISEDLIFQIALLKKCKKVTIIEDNLYYYRYSNENSLTHKFNINDFERNKAVYYKVKELLINSSSKEEDKKKINNSINRFILARLRVCITKAYSYSKVNKDFDFNDCVKLYINDDLIRKIIKQYPIFIKNVQQSIFNFFIRIKSIHMIKLLLWFKYKNKVQRF